VEDTPKAGILSCLAKKRSEADTDEERMMHKKTFHPIVRNFKSIFTVASFFDLRDLARFSMVCRSFYWLSGRKNLLTKFKAKEEDRHVSITYA